jgi:orotate phosphoribosyltransferase-like protein
MAHRHQSAVSLRQQVRDLRERGMSVKQIARTLGVRASDIAPLVNAIAAEDSPPEMDPGVVGCWVSPGWSIDLTVHGHPAWRDS